MIGIASLMYYLGLKISYNYILYNATITFSVGVSFFLGKMIFYKVNNPIEGAFDIIITLILLSVWLMALLETLVIEVMENGNELKMVPSKIRRNIKKLKNLNWDDVKELPSKLNQFRKEIIKKIKEYPMIYKVKAYLQRRYNELKERF